MEYNYKVKAFEFIEKAEKLLLGKLNREFKSNFCNREDTEKRERYLLQI